jgi:hypothetical protein
VSTRVIWPRRGGPRPAGAEGPGAKRVVSCGPPPGAQVRIAGPDGPATERVKILLAVPALMRIPRR